MESIKLAIADDHKIFREGLKAILEDQPSFQIIIEAGNGRELADLLPLRKPDVVLMDIKMPVMDGMQATAYIQEHFPEVKVLALSMYHEDKYIVDMMKAGASGYILKNAEPREIIEAVTTVHAREFYFNERLSVTLVKQLIGGRAGLREDGQQNIALNERETEVLGLICQEYSNLEIAEKLFLSVRTVEGYRTRLFEKIGAKNVAGLVIFAIKQGIISV
ncbi:LuxR family two component transcriptional regulator [Anseongella ginsenosidimutans]|uniref:LuxR family two component transcriptional regulator n=1 Tax=Anseongella ginsenosidimutans TaxID=496056 RepID=A0A4R3KRL6_9SPHI|nr:response regulator transcription factor [Anseongella ginsenosidimutans]QEC53871.1 response regulator transcription factor [Anseongella ginsenosidimutans]TCS86253.1 LuxR family two component transcriptional regulator [Anseongella ginsenosidimutans]